MKRKILSILMSMTLMLPLLTGSTVHAANLETEKDSIEIFEKDFTTGEETIRTVAVSDDENILSAEGFQVNQPSPNIIIGEDERGVVPDMLLNMMPYSAIGRIKVTYYDGTSATGTGFLFASNAVATAAHVLYNENHSIAKEVTFWLPGGTGPLANYTASQMAIPQEYMDTLDSNFDWAMFHINSTVGNTVGYFGWTTNISVNTTVQVIGYPSSQMMIAGKQVKSVTTTMIKYDVDTSAGQSGSPVLNRALNNQFVAIHTTGYSSEQLNGGSRVTPRMASVMRSYRND